MKALRASIAVVACLACGQANAGDYVLTIDGKPYEVDLGEKATIKLPDGRALGVMLDKKTIVFFKSEHFSFEHPSRLAPSRTDLGDGIFQTMMASPLGTMIILQEYTAMSPSPLVDLMLNELTKEEADYGYKVTRSPSTRKLASGSQLKGKVAVSAYKDDEYTRHVLTYEARDGGLMIITQVEKDAPQEDLAVIETFWKSLDIAMK